MKITNDMTIKSIMDTYPGLGDILAQEGLPCLGCPAALGETLPEACEVHGLDADALISRLNAAI